MFHMSKIDEKEQGRKRWEEVFDGSFNLSKRKSKGFVYGQAAYPDMGGPIHLKIGLQSLTCPRSSGVTNFSIKIATFRVRSSQVMVGINHCLKHKHFPLRQPCAKMFQSIQFYFKVFRAVWIGIHSCASYWKEFTQAMVIHFCSSLMERWGKFENTCFSIFCSRDWSGWPERMTVFLFIHLFIYFLPLFKGSNRNKVP